MATFNFDQVDEFIQPQGEGFKFLKLEDHNWSAKVRFMYGPGEVFQGHTVHNISNDPRKPKYILCLREAGDPLEKCPLCASGSMIAAQFYIPVYVISITRCINGIMQPEEPVNDIKIFQRGKTFSGVLASAVRQSQGTPLVNNIFNLVRSGKAGDMQTTYMLEFAGRDNTTLQDLPQRPEIVGSYILPNYDYNKMLEIINGPQDSGIIPRTQNQTQSNTNSYSSGNSRSGVPF